MFRIINAVHPLLRCRFPNISQANCGLRQSVEERLGLPEKPKRPSSAYIKFLSKARPDIIAKNPGIAQKDILKIGSQLWNSSSEATKKTFKDEYVREYEKYSQQLVKYNDSLTPQQKEEIKEAVEELKEEKEKREIRLATAKRNKEFGKPLKPLSSFLLFSQTEQHNRGSKGLGEFQAVVSQKWQALPESSRAKYTEEAARAKAIYDKELEAWEKKMIKLGNLDLVRQKTLDEAFPKKLKSGK